MGAILRSGIVIGLAIALTGCQPPHYAIDVSTDAKGQLWFAARFLGFWPFRWDEKEIDIGQLEVVSSGKILWAIEYDRDDEKCVSEAQSRRGSRYAKYPIQYGEHRLCFRTVVEPQPLPLGQKIVIRAFDLNNGSGEFSLQKNIRLFPETDSPFESSATQEWPSAWPGRQGVWTPSPLRNESGR